MTTKIKAGVIGDGVVGTTQIADDAITADKLANSINTDIAAALPKAGGTMTGDLITTGLTVDTTTLVVDKTNNRVGIGTANPDSALHLKSTGDTVLIIEADSDNITETDNADLILYQDGRLISGKFSLDETNRLSIDNQGIASGGIVFRTGGNAPTDPGGETASTDRMMIAVSGEVGIGTGDPNSDFDIRTSGSMTIPKGTTGNRPSGTTSGRLRFNTTTTKPEIHDGTSWKTLGYGPYTADWLVVAGGGSGGDCTSPDRHGGGGGAGGLRTSYGSTSGGGSSAELDMSITPGTVYTITVGAGGASIGSSADTPGNVGANSSISGAGLTTITSLGGGGGGGNETAGSSGGSGGGGQESDGAGQAGTSGQGYAGGTGSEGDDRGGAGGGAGAVGGTTVGGAGLAVAITGSSVTYAGGGGSQGAGGAGGGGAASTAGTANTGGGGGAAGTTSGAGGSGVVILRMATGNYSGTVTGSPTVTTTGSDTVIKFTSSGTYTG
jgi:hypothetical protein